jgi:ABC-type dipeptide/oligopeptide/nickel transport system ATPase subunit
LYKNNHNKNNLKDSESSNEIDFNQSIKIDNLSFNYIKSKNVLRNLNLKILKGSKVGLIGATGSGKSTFFDILMGFLEPSNGLIAIDEIHLSEKAWNPFISKNIPLILGSSYINEYLKSIGFWLADDLFDLTPKFSIDEILQQYRSNLDIINKMTYDEIHTYYIKHKNNIDSNFNLLANQKFEFNTNNYK